MDINKQPMFTILNNINIEEYKCSGIMAVNLDGYILHLCEKCSHPLVEEYQLKQGDNILQTPMASYFSNLKEDSQVKEVGEIRKGNTLNWWSGTLMNQLDEGASPVVSKRWTEETERLVQQISLRYAHEILNALTPVYGIIQMIKNDSKNKDSEKLVELLEIAQQEIVKGKNYVNDFLNINFVRTPDPAWYPMGELITYIKTKLESQSPEFIPYIYIVGKDNLEKNVFVDNKQLRLVLQLIIKKWIDFVDEPSTIEISFHTKGEDSFQVTMKMLEGEKTLCEADNEFLFYLHLIGRSMEMNGGNIEVGNGITLDYNFRSHERALSLMNQL